jgi:hypothetical protein
MVYLQTAEVYPPAPVSEATRKACVKKGDYVKFSVKLTLNQIAKAEDYEAFLDMLIEKADLPNGLSDIRYDVVGVEDNNLLIINVSGDAEFD